LPFRLAPWFLIGKSLSVRNQIAAITLGRPILLNDQVINRFDRVHVGYAYLLSWGEYVAVNLFCMAGLGDIVPAMHNQSPNLLAYSSELCVRAIPVVADPIYEIKPGYSARRTSANPKLRNDEVVAYESD
jgi:hypothetical protein